MPPSPPAILHLSDPTRLAGLAADAEADGRRMVSRLIAEWSEGINRFDRPGERAYLALSEGRVVAVCGLNIDPYANDPLIGRVRRLYVAVAQRRRGVGSALMNVLADEARRHFRMLHVRTHDAEASAFYEALGFTRVVSDPKLHTPPAGCDLSEPTPRTEAARSGCIT
jgi:GNAT superfamily N-acetyltransferase